MAFFLTFLSDVIFWAGVTLLVTNALLTLGYKSFRSVSFWFAFQEDEVFQSRVQTVNMSFIKLCLPRASKVC